jgi:hypothetical protein
MSEDAFYVYWLGEVVRLVTFGFVWFQQIGGVV